MKFTPKFLKVLVLCTLYARTFGRRGTGFALIGSYQLEHEEAHEKLAHFHLIIFVERQTYLFSRSKPDLVPTWPTGPALPIDAGVVPEVVDEPILARCVCFLDDH